MPPPIVQLAREMLHQPVTINMERRAAPAIDDPRAYQAAGVLYLNKKARFDYLLSLPETAALGEAINNAIRLIEKDNPTLKGVLPQTSEMEELIRAPISTIRVAARPDRCQR